MPSAGISGIAVAVAGIGGVVMYAGFRGITPIQALQQISSGKPAPIANTSTQLTTPVAGIAMQGVNAALAQAAGPLAARISAAAATYKGDRYSQPRREQSGWSDCSSFCDKILTDCGVPPPVKWASTANYRLSSTWKKIPADEAQPGDVAVSSHHMVMVTGPGGSTAIGQQNPRTNVREGSVASLMGSQTYSYYRYTNGRR